MEDGYPYRGDSHVFSFKDDNLTISEISDSNTGNIHECSDNHYKYSFSDSFLLASAENSVDSIPILAIRGDSIFLFQDSTEISKLVKVDRYKHNLAIGNSDLRGTYVFEFEDLRDTISIINDSVFLCTGSSDRYYHPYYKWNICSIEGLSLLNLKRRGFPVLIIDAVVEDSIKLVFPSGSAEPIYLIKADVSFDKQRLYGTWCESRTYLETPVYSSSELQTVISFEEDSASVIRYGSEEKYSWDVTLDGDRVYFGDILTRRDGSWKIMEITDSTLSLLVNKHTIFSSPGGEEIVKFNRVN